MGLSTRLTEIVRDITQHIHTAASSQNAIAGNVNQKIIPNNIDASQPSSELSFITHQGNSQHGTTENATSIVATHSNDQGKEIS